MEKPLPALSRSAEWVPGVESAAGLAIPGSPGCERSAVRVCTRKRLVEIQYFRTVIATNKTRGNLVISSRMFDPQDRIARVLPHRRSASLRTPASQLSYIGLCLGGIDLAEREAVRAARSPIRLFVDTAEVVFPFEQANVSRRDTPDGSCGPRTRLARELEG